MCQTPGCYLLHTVSPYSQGTLENLKEHSVEKRSLLCSYSRRDCSLTRLFNLRLHRLCDRFLTPLMQLILVSLPHYKTDHLSVMRTFF